MIRTRRTKLRNERAILQLSISGDKQELAVFVNGEADGTAKLILGGDVGWFAESIIRGEIAAAIVIVRFAVPLVGAGFGDHVDQTAGGASEFRSKAVGDYLEFLHGLEGNREVLGFERAENFAEVVVEGVLAVHDDAEVIALLAAEADAAAQAGNHLRRGA